MNRVGRIALGATALAMTGFGFASPASATQTAPGDREDVSISILSSRLSGDDVVVRLRYSCDEDNDRADRRRDDDARITVSVSQDGNRGSESTNVDCDGSDTIRVRVSSDDDDFERGNAFVRATIRQDGDRDSDSDRVFLRGGGRDRN